MRKILHLLNKRILPIFLLIPLLVISFVVVTKSTVHADSPSKITGCLSSTGGVLYDFLAGDSPRHTCSSPDDEVSLGAGDITSVLTSGGLTGGGTSGDVTVSVANGGITPDKISNDASESSRIQTWVDDSTDNSFAATGGVGHHTITSDISVTVPSGKAYNYTVTYDGGLLYNYGERTSGNSSFYGVWAAQLVTNSTLVGTQTGIVQTGYRQNWSDLGNSSWRVPYHATWFVRLTAGTYTLGVDVSGYSDGTMDYAHFQYNHLQVMRVF